MIVQHVHNLQHQRRTCDWPATKSDSIFYSFCRCFNHWLRNFSSHSTSKYDLKQLKWEKTHPHSSPLSISLFHVSIRITKRKDLPLLPVVCGRWTSCVYTIHNREIEEREREKNMDIHMKWRKARRRIRISEKGAHSWTQLRMVRTVSSVRELAWVKRRFFPHFIIERPFN